MNGQLGLKELLNALLKAKWLIVGLTVLGVAAGFGLSKIVTPLYKIEAYAFSPVLDNFHSKKILEEIQLLVDNKKTDVLKERMALSGNTVSALRKVSIEISNSEKGYFNFELEMTDGKAADSLIYGVLNFFESNEYSGKIYDAVKENFDKLQQAGANEWKDAQQMKGKLMEQSESTEADYAGSIFEESYNIKIKEEDYKQKLKMHTIVELMNDPVAPTSPFFPNRTIFMLVFGFLGAALSITIAVIRAALQD